MPDTLGSMAASVRRWLRGETLADDDIYDAINDAVESLWQVLILASLDVMMGGPVSLTITSGDERETLVSIADPTTAPTAVDLAGQSTLGATTFYMAYTYVTESGTETNISSILTYARGLDALAQVSIPPTIIPGAIGWNLYVGTTNNNLAKQNDEPITILTDVGSPTNQTYTEPATGFLPYPELPAIPLSNTTGDNIFMLRHLEFKTTQGIYKPYNAGDIDSDFMRRFAATIATPSDYQGYAWDLLNQNQLEIRPAAGQTFSPRYFYIVKPRRMRYPNSPLPFPTVPQVKYLRSQSLSDIFLSLHEYEASQAWEAKAEAASKKAVRAVTQMNTNKNATVTPYMY